MVSRVMDKIEDADGSDAAADTTLLPVAEWIEERREL